MATHKEVSQKKEKLTKTTFDLKKYLFFRLVFRALNHTDAAAERMRLKLSSVKSSHVLMSCDTYKVH